MTPFAGEGVNLAMLDALELAQNVVPALQPPASEPQQTAGAQARLNDAIRKYEESMFERARETGQETFDNMNLIFAKTPDKFVEKMKRLLPPFMQTVRETAAVLKST
jgi:2-polyprenyl-6-methoxyphenol hydroxylase-like FAD-dependent oxidoreductase